MNSPAIARLGWMLGAASVLFFSQALLGAPANDNYANRIHLAGSNFQFSGTITFGSFEPDDYELPFAGNSSVWWDWVAPSDGIAVVQSTPSSAPSAPYPTLAVLKGAYPSPVFFYYTNLLAAVEGDAADFTNFRVRAGELYTMGLFGNSSWVGTSQFTVSIQPAPSAPANDNFATRAQLAGVNIDFSGTVYGATSEAPERSLGWMTDNDGTVWWSWAAPVDGYAAVTLPNPVAVDSERSFQFFVKSGGSLATLAPVASMSIAAGRSAAFRAHAGVIYSLSLVGPASTNITTQFRLHLEPLPAAPANDAFANRSTLSGSSVSFAGNLFGSTLEAGDPFSFSQSAAEIRGSVWWKWTAVKEGFADLVFPSTFPIDGYFWVFKGADSIGSLETNILRITGTLPLTYSFRTHAGETYVLGYSGRGDMDAGQQFSLTQRALLPPPPLNDNFVNRTVLQGFNLEFGGSVLGASYEANEPGSARDPEGGSLWWSWTPVVSGVASFTFSSSIYSSSLEIFKSGGSTIPSIATRLGVFGNDPTEFSVQAGETYLFAIYGASFAEDTEKVTLHVRVKPPNDNFANRIALQPDGQDFSGSVYGATLEAGEPYYWPINFADSSGGSIWWSWTPAISGFAAITLPTPPQSRFEPPSVLLVRRATTLEGFVSAPLALDNKSLDVGPGGYTAFPIVGGETYAIGLFGSPFTNITDQFTLTVSDKPIILKHPQDQLVKPGGATFFSVFAPGASRESIRWQFNGSDIAGAVGSTLPLYNVSSGSEGSYRAVVGVAPLESFSESATLTLFGVETRPVIRLSHAPSSINNFTVEVEGEANQFYSVEASGNFQFWRSLFLGSEHPYNMPAAQPIQLIASDVESPYQFIRATRRGDFQQACIVNLRRIELAKEEWRVRTRRPEGTFTGDFAQVEINQFFADQSTPRCPQGGTYNYGAIGNKPQCSVFGHTL